MEILPRGRAEEEWKLWFEGEGTRGRQSHGSVGGETEDFNKLTAVVFPPDVIVEGDQIVHVNGENRVERFVEIFEKADRIFMVVRWRCWFVAGQPLLDFQRLC